METDGLCLCGCGQRTNIAKRTDSVKGWSKGMPQRYLFGHVCRKSPDEYLVDDVSGCWNWQRCVNTTGYGITKRPGGGQTVAHRVYYERSNGPVPDGLELDHLCRNKRCVNPEHLEPVTHAENMRRWKDVA